MPAPAPAQSSVIEDYVLAVYRLQAAGEPVLGARLAEQLHVAPASVTEMLGRMQRDGLIEGRRPVRLSDEGFRIARTLVTRHRLGGRFLLDLLGFRWDQVHAQAHRLEHARPPTPITPGDTAVARRIAYEDPGLLSLLTSLSIGLGTRGRVDAAGSPGERGRLRIEVEGAPRMTDAADADAVLVET